MNNIVKRVIREESGAAMVLAVILLLVGGLITASLLSFMGTGLVVGPAYEGRVAELYGADAGVEDAVWRIQQQGPEIEELYCGAGNHTWTYPEDDEPAMIINGKSVEVTIAYVDPFTYKVVSTATGDDSGTKVTAYVTGASGNYSAVTDHILISQHEIDWGNKVVLNYTGDHGPYPYYPYVWPTQGELSGWYWLDVRNETAYDRDTIDLGGDSMKLGPLYRNGGLTIKNSDNDNVAVLTLDGTLYITGDTSIGYGTSQNFEMTLQLNGNTIFVGSSTSKYALYIGANCNIKGPGVLVAFGGIYFKPKAQVTTDPVFILSLSGATLLQPSGSFYGAIGGGLEVDVQTGKNPTVIYPEAGFGDINFPGCTESKPIYYSIASWQVTPLAPSEQ
jgi:hypothetical protein